METVFFVTMLREEKRFALNILYLFGGKKKRGKKRPSGPCTRYSAVATFPHLLISLFSCLKRLFARLKKKQHDTWEVQTLQINQSENACNIFSC